MVRGDRRCPMFCGTCKADCRCEADFCERCHTCRDKAVFRKSQWVESGCSVVDHDCEWHLLVVEEERAKEMKEKAVKEKMRPVLSKFPKLLEGDLVKVVVGSWAPETRFVSKTVLVENAEYFKSFFSFAEKASEPSDNEGNEKGMDPIVLDSEVDRVDAFDCFIQFGYWGDYFPTGNDETDMQLEAHVHVYVLAERLQATVLKELSARKASAAALAIISYAKAKSTKASDDITWGVDYDFSLQSLLPCLIEDVYSNTPNTPDPDEENTSATKEPMRYLISAVSAYFLQRLKGVRRFQECLRTLPDFSVDLMMQLKSGNELEVGEDGFLMRN